MAFSEKFRFILEADAKGAVKGFQQVGAAADRELGKADNRVDKLGGTLTKVGASMLAFGGLAAAGLFKAAQAAGDLDEAVNLTQRIFGDAADDVLDFGKTTANALGISNRAALAAAANFGGLFVNLGHTQEESADLSKQLVVLAADMASAFDMQPAEALEALRSGLTGEIEPLKKFNVLLSESKMKEYAAEVLGLTGTLTEQQKVQARLGVIMAETQQIQGDATETAGSAANAQKRLTANWEDFQATLGQAALPVLQEALGALNAMLSGFQSLSPGVQSAISRVALFGTAALLLVGGLTTLVGQLIKARDTLRTLGPAAIKAGRGLGILVAAVVGATIAWNIFEETANAGEKELLESMEQFTNQLTNSFDKATGSVTDFTKELLLQFAAQTDLADAMSAAGVTIDDFIRASDEGTDAVSALKEEVREHTDGTGKFSTALSDMHGMLQQANRDFERNASLIGDANIASDKLLTTTDDLTEGEKRTSEAAAQAAAKIREIRDAARDARAELQPLDSVLSDVAGSALDLHDSANRVDTSMANLTQTAAEFNDETNETKPTITEIREAFSQYTRDVITHAGEMRSAGASTNEIRGFIEQAQGNIEGLRGQFGLMPGAVAVYNQAMQSALREIFTRVRVTAPSIFYTQHIGPQGTPSLTPRHGQSIVFHRGGLFEAPLGRREGFAILESGERVLSTRQNEAFERGMMGGGGGDTFNISNLPVTMDMVMDAIVNYKRRKGGFPKGLFPGDN